MGDNPNRRGKPDRTRIGLAQRHERRYWAKKFGVPQWVLEMISRYLAAHGNYGSSAYIADAFESTIRSCKQGIRTYNHNERHNSLRRANRAARKARK